MIVINFIQWAIGLVFAVYIFKGLLGKFQGGDFSKAIIIGAIWLGLALFTSGIIKVV